MINLTDCTFIIPIRIDSPDRAFNFEFVIKYLLDNFDTTIIIKESDRESKVLNLLKNLIAQTRYKHTKFIPVKYIFEQSDDPIFFRTRLLNEMLSQVTTPVTVNYDIDVFMNPQAYVDARDKIINENFDLIYPYFRGESQIRITNHECLVNGYHDDAIGLDDFNNWSSVCGHCAFFKTESYRSGYWENENFLSYGQEDRERMDRFQKLGYKVAWLDNYIYHIEHSRGPNSDTTNPQFTHNQELYTYLSSLDRQGLIDYYEGQEYLKKYL